MFNDSVLSAFYKVYINGKEIDLERKLCITSINITEQISGSDTMTITVQDPEMVYISDNIYKSNTPIKVELGWNEDTFTYVFDGFISAIDIAFPENGMPTLTLTCLDITHNMNRTKKTRSWDKVTSADVIKKIAKEYGLKYVIQPNYTFKREDSISQSDQTDIEFIEGLCDDEMDLFICKVIGRTLYYIKKGVLSSPVYEAHYREYPFDLISFSPQINIEEKKDEEKSSDIDDNKSKDTATAKPSSSSPPVQKSSPTSKGESVAYDWESDSWKKK